MRDVKGTITILNVDRTAAAYTAFELSASKTHSAAKEEAAADAKGGGDAKEEVVALRTAPPVVKDIWQPNSYTKGTPTAPAKPAASAPLPCSSTQIDCALAPQKRLPTQGEPDGRTEWPPE